MTDDRAIRPDHLVPLAEIGHSSRLLKRGLDRLLPADAEGGLTPSLWKPVIVWDPNWLGLVYGAPESPEALSAVWGDAHSIDETRHVEGYIFSMWHEEGYDFGWDMDSSSGTLKLATNESPHDPLWDPHLRIIGSNVQGISVGTVNDGDPSNRYPGFWLKSFERSSACIVDQSGIVIRLPSLGGLQSIASAVNTGLEVVGCSSTPDGSKKAVRWQDGRIRVLPSPFMASHATGINSAGQIIGWGSNSGSYEEVYPNAQWGLVWDGEDQPVILRGVPAGITEEGYVIATGAQPHDYSNHHQARDSHHPERAFVWCKREVTHLSVPDPYRGSRAEATNAQGDIAGSAFTESYWMTSDLLAPIGEEELNDYFLNTFGRLPISPGPFPDRVPCVWLRTSLQ